MSLINQMLRDLEARQAADSARDSSVFHGLTTGTTPHRRIPVLIPMMVIVVVVVAAVFTWFAFSHRSQSAKVASAQPTAPQAVTPAVVPHRVRATRATPPSVKPHVNPVGATVAPPPPAPTHIEAQKQAILAPVRAQHRPALDRPAHRIAGASPMTAFEMHRHAPSAEQRAASAYREALVLMQQHNTGQAETKLREALVLNPDNVQASETLAALLINEGRVVEAAPIVDAARQHDGRHPTLDLLAARIRLAQGDTQGATAILKDGLALGSSRPDYMALLAALYQQQGKYAESLQAYQRAVELNPSVPAWWVGLGISEEGAGQGADAAKAYSHALQGRLPSALHNYAQQRLKALEAQHSTGASADSDLH